MSDIWYRRYLLTRYCMTNYEFWQVLHFAFVPTKLWQTNIVSGIEGKKRMTSLVKKKSSWFIIFNFPKMSDYLYVKTYSVVCLLYLFSATSVTFVLWHTTNFGWIECQLIVSALVNLVSVHWSSVSPLDYLRWIDPNSSRNKNPKSQTLKFNRM